MSVIESIVEQVEHLPLERQREVLNFAEFLQHKEKSNGEQPRRTLRGMWKGVDISAEDIDEARREMWGNFPREDF
ncbi:MAG: DUF2281 domain-containing protein [Pyrinomonadaceae bacterium]|nr:DUF2281 domain-containing protein [Pyrinomonadaceae bacterium]